MFKIFRNSCKVSMTHVYAKTIRQRKLIISKLDNLKNVK
jgi:hypothetical protein